MNIQKWFQSVTPQIRKKIAKSCGFSTAHLYAVFDGTRELSSKHAILLEKHSREENKTDPSIPIIKQGQSCSVCASCPYYKNANK